MWTAAGHHVKVMGERGNEGICFHLPCNWRKVPAIDFWPLLSDQTPTPTRFLKNCEEVGLFSELDCSFEHEFRKAQEEENSKRVGGPGETPAVCLPGTRWTPAVCLPGTGWTPAVCLPGTGTGWTLEACLPGTVWKVSGAANC